MRNGQNKRMRGRNNRKSHNPLARLYESNGPDVKVRGTASHVAEKYLQLARDAQSSGDPVSAENYFQHAEHYLRLIAAAQEQFRQSQPFSRGEGEGRDDSYDDAEMEGATPAVQGESSQPFQQPYPAREAQPREQPFGLREPQPYSGRQPSAAASEESGGLERLPAFITGGGQPQPQGPNGFDGQPDRFSHRRRRRHRPRGEGPGASAGGEAADEAGPPGE